MARRLLTPTHAGMRLGIGAARVCQLFDAGDLRGVRDSSGRRLIDEESVEELARRREQDRKSRVASEPR